MDAYAPAVPPPHNTRWNDRFAFELALQIEGSGETVEEVLRRNGFSATDMVRFSKDNTFRRKIKDYRNEIVEKGLTFRMKARVQAEHLLTTSWNMINNADVSPAVKADLIKSTVKWADLEPRKTDEVQTGGQGVSIVINLGEDDKIRAKRVIDADAGA